MHNKTIDLRKTVSELISQHPELVDIMVALGFSEIRNKVMQNTVGRVMTIPKGARMKGIALEKIVAELEKNGFYVEQSRTDRLKSYLKRLNAGESLDAVRQDFVRSFSHVEPKEIIEAEQELLRDGVSLDETKQLCDVHSALFRDATSEERARADAAGGEKPDEGQLALARLVAVDGHPLQTLTRENDAIAAVVADIEKAMACGGETAELLARLRQVSIHYAKKGNLLFPLLKTRYGISGPSDVMWTVDIEIRDELARLVRNGDLSDWKGRAQRVVERAKEMIYKENNILFPLSATCFSTEEWMRIYRDAKDFAICLDVVPATWGEAEAEAICKSPSAGAEGVISLPGGTFTPEQLRWTLNALPLEITFVDADDVNRFFNEGPKVFKRPLMALGRDVFTCHPPKVQPMVRQIIGDFKLGKKGSVQIWMERNGRPFLVNYLAVRNAEGVYLGTVEIVQDMGDAKKHFEQLK